MKKKKSLSYVIIFSSVIALILIGAASTFFYKTIIKEMSEVDNYISFVSDLNSRDLKFQQEMEREYFYEEDDKKAYTYLVEKAIPNYKSLLNDSKKQSITYGDLKEIHQLYIQSSEFYLESLLDTKKALEENNEKLHNEAYNKLLEAENLMIQHDTLLEKLAEDNAIELEWE